MEFYVKIKFDKYSKLHQTLQRRTVEYGNRETCNSANSQKMRDIQKKAPFQ